MFYPRKVMRQISEISYVGDFKLIRMSTNQDGESGLTIPLQSYNDNDNAHWKSIFDKYDTDRDGKISYQELKNMIQSSTYTNDIPSKVVKIIMRRADLDGSSFLEYPEFVAMIHRKDMQGVFGHLLKRYVHTVVPQRRTISQATHISSDITDGQYEEEYNCEPPAIGMIIISILEIFVFVWYGRPPLLIYKPCERHQAWRFLTYMFVHSGISHLTQNLFVQIMLGIPLEMVHKWWRVLIIYISGVVAGSLGTSVLDPNVQLEGASGGVYALMTAHVATILMNWSQMEYSVLQLLVFLVLMITDVSQAIYNRYVPEKEQKIAYVAHLAGAIAGLLVGINVLRNLQVKRWENFVWWASIITYTALMIAAILWNIFYIKPICHHLN